MTKIESVYEEGDFVYVELLKTVYLIDKIALWTINNKETIILRVGIFSLEEKDVRKATLSEIKKYKLKDIFTVNH